MRATLVVTFLGTTQEEKLHELITKITRQRRLLVLSSTIKGDVLTISIDGQKLDIYVLTNAIASGFPQVRVRLEAP